MLENSVQKLKRGLQTVSVPNVSGRELTPPPTAACTYSLREDLRQWLFEHHLLVQG